MTIVELRGEYHRRICDQIIRLRRDGETEYPNFADKGNRSSREIALGIVERLNCAHRTDSVSGQALGNAFEALTKDFLMGAFGLLHHLRPGRWHYSVETPISDFDQYEHLADLEDIIEQIGTLASSLGTDYIIKPDIVIGRWPVPDEEINRDRLVISPTDPMAELTPLRQANVEPTRLILHASVSCKWTLRSDRSQNARAEALNLIRNRKGRLPHIVAVTAEPLPTRIASLALGTGDLDCVYHFALHELKEALAVIDNEDQMDMLRILVEGRRLRDISDLPFDLAT
jgi:hypothetical protein